MKLYNRSKRGNLSHFSELAIPPPPTSNITVTLNATYSLDVGYSNESFPIKETARNDAGDEMI